MKIKGTSNYDNKYDSTQNKAINLLYLIEGGKLLK